MMTIIITLQNRHPKITAKPAVTIITFSIKNLYFQPSISSMLTHLLSDSEYSEVYS